MVDSECLLGPLTARRVLAGEFERLRNRSGLAAAEVARRIGSSQSRMSRIESGRWRITVQETLALSVVHDLDADKRDELVALARANLNDDGGHWEPYQLDRGTTRFVALEDEAHTERAFGALLVPGLLQTEAYAREVIANGPEELTVDEIEQRVKARACRRTVLTRERAALRFHAVIDEAVLHRMSGGPQIMAEQIDHIAAIADNPKVSVQLLPFSAGAHPGMESSFVILSFNEPADPTAYAECCAGETWVEEPRHVDRFELAFGVLTQTALSPADTIIRMVALRDQMR